ncbi:hypothetical protein DAPPUDRAFT_237375 [Daphnia pulex]|uniref:Uncharacterized protein n=1 Tax=Daphnia pulex TaxID=6669 RepID=E9G3S1_DAPPU|nr:hypothetical protein DAPPUDRAFT_237375 [Daphnia pulex]|eukprot:EFX85816.1 hypothetical protein DAPPUDRAFT_237375 [Daphnia pulex]
MKKVMRKVSLTTPAKCDLVLEVIVMTPGGFAVVYFAGGYTYYAIVIPMPKLLDNSYAVAKPFQVSVRADFC